MGWSLLGAVKCLPTRRNGFVIDIYTALGQRAGWHHTCGVRVDFARSTLQPRKHRSSTSASRLRSRSWSRRASPTAPRQAAITRVQVRRHLSARNLCSQAGAAAAVAAVFFSPRPS